MQHYRARGNANEVRAIYGLEYLAKPTGTGDNNERAKRSDYLPSAHWLLVALFIKLCCTSEYTTKDLIHSNFRCPY